MCTEMWSWSHGSWIYNYLCNQCLSPLKFWVRILMCTYNRINGAFDLYTFTKVYLWKSIICIWYTGIFYVRANDIISFLMVDGLHSNVVITFLMGDQNTNEPVMWALFVINECIQPLQMFVTRAYRIIWSTYCEENLCKSYSTSGHKSINPVINSVSHPLP